jgi:hypothetical protein
MHIPSFFDQMNVEYNSQTPMNMTPSAAPGGPVRNPEGINSVKRANFQDITKLQGATMRTAMFRNEPCEDNHFSRELRPGKFKGARMPLMNQYGNFHNQPDIGQGLLSQYYIRQNNPIIKQADMFMPQFNSPIPMPA